MGNRDIIDNYKSFDVSKKKKKITIISIELFSIYLNIINIHTKSVLLLGQPSTLPNSFHFILTIMNGSQNYCNTSVTEVASIIEEFQNKEF